MTETVLCSATKEVVIGFDRPFVIIGERINPTGRKKLAEEMARGQLRDRDRRHDRAGRGRRADARRQRRHPARRRAGDPRATRSSSCSRSPTCRSRIDSSIVEALEAGLSVYQGKALVNSVTGEDEQMERVLPLVAKHGAAVVAISNDETGISEDPDVRFEVARKIVSRAADYGIPREDVVVDPLVMPIGAMGTAGRQVFRLVRRLQEELGVNTTCGASNVSFGLPNRPALNAAFLPMAIASGLTSAITSPLHDGDAPRDLGGRRDDGQRRALRRLDRPQRRLRRGGADRPPRRPRGPAEARRRDASGTRPAEPLASGLSRRRSEPTTSSSSRRRGGAAAFARGHDRARGGAPARGRPRLGLRRPRHLRALPGRGERGRAREARDRLGRLAPLAGRARSSAPTRPSGGLAPGRRLGCTALRRGRVVIDVPPESQVHRQVVRKEADAHPIEVDPVVRLHYVEVEEPDLASPTSDLGRLREALEREWELTGLAFDPHVVAALQRALRSKWLSATRSGAGRVTVAVHDGTT